jgi:hypothetical protein
VYTKFLPHDISLTKSKRQCRSWIFSSNELHSWSKKVLQASKKYERSPGITGSVLLTENILLLRYHLLKSLYSDNLNWQCSVKSVLRIQTLLVWIRIMLLNFIRIRILYRFNEVMYY